ncbi:hypothetical protein HWC92_gp36 [Flavobacterium phage vB_FspS_morran9-1]|uniref:Uncharacterized protein n=11 Tax=Lillamyvirus TaxID=2843418 RepID=A0A6B9LH78_9CAUD|nr:hypothetical protein HWC91_gp37 [Flavobacterium phage vB_FspS_lillamy9-1]YP_009854964.1 hypothetical protein HWC92_gp36 [Flavobacterium phage vB_FspS_morran9-1]YP_009855173.1 hypothetical protein HWC95_gp37 [Flavobacterium phage vB_FspS_sniff9-1]YP_009855246.1 hypothetical protein HWC96_gp36 [Flavobacterium phage vB_FspS_snork6-1]QHB39138.1 hypothetical protein lillamy92_gp037 [Flavobacterium phage vB_FspS_lillamy9-2]QHB39211.1 hypothetical protein lillamy93_gp037 [Flavobacterium phage vB_F
MKTPEQRFEQIKRIMRKLEKRGQNNEKINSEYKKLLKNELNR